MENYIMIDGVKVNLSDETVRELKSKLVQSDVDWLKKTMKYWYIDDCGDVVWGICEAFPHNKLTGNYFKTKEIAERKFADIEDEISQKFVKIENYVRNNDDGFIPNWSDYTQCKYYVYYDCRDEKWRPIQVNQSRTNSFHMSKEMVDKVIEMLNNGRL
jgi:hypothetical protein